MKDYSGEAFLNKLYKDLHMSDVVMHTATPSDNPNEKISKYMERLERVHSSNNDSIKNYVKNLYHQKYIIKEENLPSYLSEEQKKYIIDAQIKTFDMWLNYLTDENAKYPMWAKYWAFQGMLKIGTYDEATDTYKKRTEKTTNPFIEANPEVIARCIDLIVKQVNKQLSDISVGEEGLKRLIESGSFQKLYTALLKEQKKNKCQRSGFEGQWIKYNQGSREDAIKLYNSLQGYGTEWCTAGSEQVAIDQVCGGGKYSGGDFYVYYTLDENNEYKIPRIAIRMDGTINIGEIRGVADASQNLEDGMEDIVERKLNEFTFLSIKDRERYMMSVNDCKMLTKLNQKTAKREELTIDEYMFIFEINRQIAGFGWNRDSRIEKIRWNNTIKNYETALKLIPIKGWTLKYASKELKNNPDIVKLAVTECGCALEYASEGLRNNPDIVKLAVTQSCYAIDYASIALKNNFQFMKEMVMQNTSNLLYVSFDLRASSRFMKEIVKKDGLALEYASKELQNNFEIVKIAVKQNGDALRYASEELINNFEIVKIAVTQDGFTLAWASEELKNNLDIVRLAVKQNGAALKYASQDLQNNPIIVISAVLQNGEALQYASKELRNNFNIVSTAVMQNGLALRYASEELGNNPNIVKSAVMQNVDAFLYAGENARSNPDIVKFAVMQNGLLLKYAEYDAKSNPDVVKSAVLQNGEALKYSYLQDNPHLQRLSQMGIEEMRREQEFRKQGKSK